MRQLPKGDAEVPEGSTVKHWSVYKRKRRSPSKTTDANPGPAEALADGGSDPSKPAMVQGTLHRLDYGQSHSSGEIPEFIDFD